MKKILIIGGGASGMMAAIGASKNGAKVTIYEYRQELGKKILATGNGKCNLSNRHLDVSCYNSSDADKISEYLRKFDSEDSISLFKSFGLLIKDKNGYLYPAGEQAVTVRDILVSQLRNRNVEIVTEILVEEINKKDNKFSVRTNKGTGEFDNIILACGSYGGIRKNDRVPGNVDGYSLAYHFGHSIIPIKPALTQLVCKEEYFKDIAGVRTECFISLLRDNTVIAEEFGEMQITDFGVSGIPIFQLSRHVSADANGSYSLLIDLIPGIMLEDFELFIRSRLLAYQGMSVEEFFLGLLNNKLNSLFIKLNGLEPGDLITEENREKVFKALHMIKEWRIEVKKTKGFENAQCCSGGIPLSEIDLDCQSLKVPGLYITGEMLDVDGKCGGYNLQWAWTTGYIAGVAAGKN